MSLSPDSSCKMISVVSEWWMSSRSLGSQPVGGVNSAREQDSSIGGSAGDVCLVVVHMEEEVQDRVQVEVEREEQGVGDTRKETKRGTEREQTINQPLIMDDHEYDMTRSCRHSSQWCVTSFSMRTVQEKNDV